MMYSLWSLLHGLKHKIAAQLLGQVQTPPSLMSGVDRHRGPSICVAGSDTAYLSGTCSQRTHRLYFYSVFLLRLCPSTRPHLSQNSKHGTPLVHETTCISSHWNKQKSSWPHVAYIRFILVFSLSVLVCLELQILYVTLCCFSLSLSRLLFFRNFHLRIKLAASLYTI